MVLAGNKAQWCYREQNSVLKVMTKDKIAKGIDGYLIAMLRNHRQAKTRRAWTI